MWQRCNKVLASTIISVELRSDDSNGNLLCLCSIAFISYNQLQSAPPAPEEELEFWYESCGEGYPHGTCICGVSTVPVKSPQTFKMSTIKFYEDREVITLHTYYFGAELDSGAKIVFVINATSPVNLQLVLVNRTDADVLSLGNEVAYYSRVIIEAPKITSYFHELNVQEKGLYIFVFDVAQPKPVATVTFEAEYGS